MVRKIICFAYSTVIRGSDSLEDARALVACMECLEREDCELLARALSSEERLAAAYTLFCDPPERGGSDETSEGDDEKPRVNGRSARVMRG